MKTTIDYGDGISLVLDLGDGADRSWREYALALKRRAGCELCNHHVNAHGPSGCTVAQDKIGGGKGKCGCVAVAAKKGRAA